MCRKTPTRIIKDRSGAAAIEYDPLAGLVSVAAIGAMSTLGTSLGSVFNTVSTTFASVVLG